MSLIKNTSPQKSTTADRGVPYGGLSTLLAFFRGDLCPLIISASKHGMKLKLFLSQKMMISCFNCSLGVLKTLLAIWLPPRVGNELKCHIGVALILKCF